MRNSGKLRDKQRINFRFYFYPFLIFVIIFAFWFMDNASDLYGKIGDYFYGKNNIQKAQTFYEKSFALGNRSFKTRDNYVNSIINSPLTINSQEKLVNIIKDDVDDVASKNAEYFMYNLKREIHNKYPDNYILQATYNQKVIHWGKLPITYGFKNAYNVPDDIIKAVNDAFDEWQRVSSCKIKFSQVKINPDIWIEFINESVSHPKEGIKYVVAYTTPVISGNTLENMIIKLNLIDLEGKMYSPNQIYNTSLHEIFHALGFMGHSYEKENIMHMAKDNETLINDTRVNLTYADKITLDLLYKIKPDITNSNNLEYKYVPYLIVGGSRDMNYTKMREAKNYIRKAPYLPNGYIDYAQGLLEQGRYSDAIKCLEKAYRLSGNNDTKYIIRYNLAVANYYEGSYILARNYLDEALNIKDNDELHVLSAEIYVKQNDFKNAINEYKYLTAKNPQNMDYVINLANIYIKKKNYIKARTLLKNYIKQNPSEKNNPRFNAYRKLFL